MSRYTQVPLKLVVQMHAQSLLVSILRASFWIAISLWVFVILFSVLHILGVVLKIGGIIYWVGNLTDL